LTDTSPKLALLMTQNIYLIAAVSRAWDQMVNVAHRSQRGGDAGSPEHAQAAALLRRQRRSTTPGNPIPRYVSVFQTQPAQ
jgi:hypothetical protein